jgi:hypothetical protein
MAWKNTQDHLKQEQVCKIRAIWGDAIFVKMQIKDQKGTRTKQKNIRIKFNQNL